MNNVILAEPSTLALAGVAIVFLLILIALAIVAVPLIIYFLRRKESQEKKTSPTLSHTEVIPRKCPQCGAELKPDVPEGLCPACLLQRGIATEGGVPPGTPPFTPPPFAELAKLFPQLEILEPIGQGGMGAVYKARQPALDRLVALKILAPRSGGDVDFAERFTREARALAKLNHPNIVAVYDFGRAELPPGQDAQQRVPTTIHYFIMEYVDGLNLRQIEQVGKLQPREALQIIPQICGALQFAHDEGIVHRDIKPENILLDKKGRVKIADFGLAKIVGLEAKDFRLTGARDVMGTPHYMAPEQVEHPQAVDHRADIYSLGVVFYEMLTGELPLGKFQPPSKKVQIDVRLDEVVLHALEKEPERRYQQASEVKTQVETIAATSESSRSRREEAQTETAGTQSQLPPAITAFRRGKRVGLWVFLLIVLAAAVITFLLPKTYVGIARVRLTGPSPQNNNPYYVQNEFQIIESDRVLQKVATSLNLGQRWGKRFNGGRPLSNGEVMALIRHGIDLRKVRNTDMIGIQFFSQSPKDAVAVANKIAETYCALPPGPRGEIIDHAMGPLHPIRPNFLLNIFIGIVAGGIIGIFGGLTVGLFSFWRLRALQPRATPPVQKPDRFWLRFAIILACVILIPIAIAVVGMLAAIAIPNFVRARHYAQQAAAQQQTQQSWQLWQSQKLDEAAAKFREAVKLVPDNANAWNGLGWATFNAGNTSEAEKAFQKAISIEPDQPGALNGLGQIYLSQGKYDQAETYLLKAAPRAPAAWYGLTRLYLLEGKFANAEKWAQQIVDAGQANDLVRQMLKDAQEKHLSQGLRVMIEPASTANPSTNPVDSGSQSAMPAIEAWLKLMDNGDYAKSWETAAESFHGAISEMKWVAKSKEVRQPLGKVLSRKLSTSNQTSTLPGMPSGSYFIAKFDTAFANFKSATETVTFALTDDNQWKAIAYLILPDNSAKTSSVAVTNKQPALSAVQAWLKLMDNGDYGKGWETAADSFHNAITKAEWVAKSREIRQPLGKVLSRKLSTAERTSTLPGMPKGSYFTARFDTAFANFKPATETVTFALTDDNQWKAVAYLIQPGTNEKEPVVGPAKKTAVAAAKKWLEAIDGGHYAESWRQAAAIVQTTVSEADWERLMNTTRKPLGTLVSRKLKSAEHLTQLPGAPDGQYVVMQFETSFANKKSAIETVTFMQEKDGRWKAAGYFIK